MNYKLKIIIAIFFIATIMVAVSAYMYYAADKGYIKNLNVRWDIALSGNYKLQFYEIEDENIFGDGYRYAILVSDKHINGVCDLNLLNCGMEQVEEVPELEEVLKVLKIPKDQFPQNTKTTYLKKRDSLNYIYIMTDEKGEKIYIIESFI